MRFLRCILFCSAFCINAGGAQAQRIPQSFDSAAAVLPRARAAADLAPIDNHFMLSAVIAVPAGYLALIAPGADRSERLLKGIVVASAVGVASLFVHANEGNVEPPDTSLEANPENLRDAYSRAYRARVQSRQSNHVLGGAALGFMGGLLILFTTLPKT